MLARQDEVNIMDAAVILGVSRWTILRWSRSGYLKCRRRNGTPFPLLQAVIAVQRARARVTKLKAAQP